MRWLDRATPVVMLTVALMGVTCALPTDKSNEVFIAVHVPKQVVLQGQILPVSAQLWQRTGADSVEIKNASFLWGTTNEALATVKNTGYGGAGVTGITPGTVDLTVRAVSFEKAPTQYVTLRVSKPLEIDSVRPATAHFGDLLTIYGVGVDSIFIASLAGVNLIEYPFSRLRDSAGLGQITFWVPPPAHTDSLFYLGAGVFGFDTATTDVLKIDLFEPNDTSPDGPTNINLDVQGPWPGTLLDPVIFANPALAFEPVERSSSGEDWYRFFAADTTQAVTIFVQYPSLAGDTSGTRIFLIDSLYYDANGDPTKDPIEKFVGRDSADFIGSIFYRCKGFVFGPPMASRESTTVALKTLPSHALHLLTNFTRPQRYGLTVARGYFTADPLIRADAYEENDMCHFADAGNRRISLPLATSVFSDTLTIDNPHEIDWLRLDIPGSGPVGVTFTTASRPFPGNPRDTSDIDLYVLTTPNPSTGTGLTLVALDTTAGSTSNVTAILSAGASYYIAIQDFAGVPTRYSLCMARGLTPCPAVAPAAPLSGGANPIPSHPQRARVARRGPVVEPAGRALLGRSSSRP